MIYTVRDYMDKDRNFYGYRNHRDTILNRSIKIKELIERGENLRERVRNLGE
jgi:hypothetical protein